MAKKIEARVKESSPLGKVIAFSGHEYVRNEWRPVPEGVEDEASRHDFLDAREVGTEKLIEPVKGTAEEYLADKKGIADQYIEDVLEEAKDEPAMDNTETAKKRKSRKSKTVTAETEEG